MKLFVLCSLLWLAGADEGSSWDWHHRGDVRAKLTVPPELANRTIAARIVWRRRDADPGCKRVLVTDRNNTELSAVSTPVLDQHSGVVVFSPTAAGSYYVYWLAYTQSGIGHITFAWDAVQSDWRTAATFQLAKGAAGKWQNFSFPAAAAAGRRFRVRCPSTFGGFQPFLQEIAFATAGEGWLPNHATASNPAPIAHASSWQPTGDDQIGAAWCAMDGNVTTRWDPREEGAWLEVAFDEAVVLTAFAVMTHGDIAHDPTALLIEVPPPSPGGGGAQNWTELPLIPQSNIEIQPRTAFESFAPMELVANSTETAAVVAAAASASPSGAAYVVFTEHREFPVRMRDHIPYRWITARFPAAFSDTVVRGDYYTFQIAIFVPASERGFDLAPMQFFGFPVDSNVTCFNFGGVDARGNRFDAPVAVVAGQVLSLWIGLHIPGKLVPGAQIDGRVVLGPTDELLAPTTVPVLLTVSDEAPVIDPAAIDADPSNYTRLRWLDSWLALDNELVPPYTAVETIAGLDLPSAATAKPTAALAFAILNREVRVDTSGLLSGITVTTEATPHHVLESKQTELLGVGGMSLTLLARGHGPVTLSQISQRPQFRQNGPG